MVSERECGLRVRILEAPCNIVWLRDFFSFSPVRTRTPNYEKPFHGRSWVYRGIFLYKPFALNATSREKWLTHKLHSLSTPSSHNPPVRGFLRPTLASQ